MESESKKNIKKNVDDEIRFFLQKKKDENSALRKLLVALENTKSANQVARMKQ
jgi:hypothetical protein